MKQTIYIINQAEILKQYYQKLINNQRYNPETLMDRLINKHDLQQKQKDFLKKTAERTHKAKQIITDIVRNNDAEGIYKQMMRKKPPKKVVAVSRNIMIEFLRHRWNYQDRMGQAHISQYDPITTEKGLEKLTYEMPTIKVIERRVKAKRWELAGEEMNEYEIGEFIKMMDRRIREHEQRHVIDNIMGNENLLYQEAAAEIHEGSKTISKPTTRKHKTTTKALHKWPTEMPRAISYVITTTKPEELANKLRQIKKFLMGN